MNFAIGFTNYLFILYFTFQMEDLVDNLTQCLSQADSDQCVSHLVSEGNIKNMEKDLQRQAETIHSQYA